MQGEDPIVQQNILDGILQVIELLLGSSIAVTIQVADCIHSQMEMEMILVLVNAIENRILLTQPVCHPLGDLVHDLHLIQLVRMKRDHKVAKANTGLLAEFSGAILPVALLYSPKSVTLISPLI